MFYDKVKAYCQSNGLNDSTFEKKCGLANGTLQGWKKNGYKPRLETLEKIANATETPINEWIG